MRSIFNIAEIVMYVLAVYNLVIGYPSKYWVFFGIGLLLSIVKRIFRR